MEEKDRIDKFCDFFLFVCGFGVVVGRLVGGFLWRLGCEVLFSTLQLCRLLDPGCQLDPVVVSTNQPYSVPQSCKIFQKFIL